MPNAEAPWYQQLPPPAAATTACTCDTCGAAYLDYREGHIAHREVFGHRPRVAVSDTAEGNQGTNDATHPND